MEATAAARVSALEDLLERLAQARLTTPPSHAACVLDPADDPTHTFSHARALEDSMRGLLAEGAITKAVEPVLESGTASLKSWLACHRQAAEIDSAVAGLLEASNIGQQQVGQASEALAGTRQTLEAAASDFSRIHIGLACLDAGEATLQSAQTLLGRAAVLEQDRRFLDASRTLTAIQNLAKQTTGKVQQAQAHLQQLGGERDAYTRRLSGLDASRSEASSRILRYGGSASGLSLFSAPMIVGPQDYAVLVGQIDDIEEAWEDRVRSARRAHEEEQRRKREAAEQARRRAARARQAAASASHTTWKSSSSSSSFSSSRSRSSSSSSRRSSSRSSSRSSGGGGSFGGGSSSGGGGGW